ncbi:MFS general substrate transporter [Gymnopus androsaceus JB14]|uniref:MFS general substrate transporter n=1 Tax=Gymnopus androsaceus JB14 TaxID=1447944 RepID=A0A6A4GLD0_9AGAR|nr:MFS general substrate transporter [Gymnopus androsaceus JB14]
MPVPTTATSNGSDRASDNLSAPKPPALTVKRTPLPKFQIFLTLMIQGMEPITATVIYAFITQCIRMSGITHGDEKKTGYFAGIIESTFFFSECLSVFHWGRASDAYGRRSVLLLGPLGLAVAMFGFGLSKSFWSMVFFRAAQGIFNGNIGVSRTVMAELTDHTNRVDVFAFLPIMWSGGSTLGPAIGGLFANPATQWPKVFGGINFFIQYPFFLPCAIAGTLAFLVFSISYIGLKETSPKFIKKEARAEENAPLLSTDNGLNYGSTAPDTATTETPPPTFTGLLSYPLLRITLLNRGFLAFTEMCYGVLIPLVYSTSIPVGGLGLSPYQLGITMGTYGFLGGILNVLVLKRILKRLGPRRTYILSYATLFFDLGMFWVLRSVVAYYGEVNAVVWTLIVAQLTASTFIHLMWNSMALLVISSAPAGALGATNGLAQVISSATRTLAPTFASSIFSISLETRLFGGHLLELVMLIVTLVGILVSFRLPKSLNGFETSS